MRTFSYQTIFLGCVLFFVILFGLSQPTKAATASLIDGRIGEVSNVDVIGVGGSRKSDWSSPPINNSPNNSYHQGREGGIVEDQGKGFIRGFLNFVNGKATMHLQDVHDVKKEKGHLRLWVKGNGHIDIPAPLRENGNWRTLSIEGVQKKMEDFSGKLRVKLSWIGEPRKGHKNPQDGWGLKKKVCK